MIVGHTDVVASLEKELPPVTLLHGPRSVGKRTLAEHLLQHHDVPRYDALRYNELRVDDAHEIKEFASRYPLRKFKVVVANLDYATSSSLNALLKLLEEPPPTIRFILIASRPTLLTVESRAATFRLGYLTDAEVAEILVTKRGWSQEDARFAAKLSKGQVSNALAVPDLDFTKAPVVTLLRAAAEGDRELLMNGLAKLDQPHADLLLTWTHEARTGLWSVFSPSDSSGLHLDTKSVDQMRKILEMGARPKIAAKLALMEIMEARRGR